MSSLQSGLILVLVIVGVALLLLVRRIAFMILVSTFRRLFRPMVRLIRLLSRRVARVLRFLRIISRTPPAKPGLAVGSVIALSGGTIARTFSGGVETDEAIAKDFDKKSVVIERTKQLFCTWLAPATAERVPYDRARAEQDEAKATHFFSTDIKINSNPLNLYEDIDGAFIVELFKDSDKPCFFVLSEFRKTINANVLALSVLFSVIVSVVAVVNILFSTSVDFYRLVTAADSERLALLGLELNVRDYFNKFAFAVLTCFAGYFVMMLFYHTTYKNFQLNNGQQLNNYLVHYLDGINIAFREIGENAARTVTAEEEQVDQMKHETVLWITNLQWMGFRVFFIEYFLRNVIFQVHRNSSYYVLLVPLAFVLAMVATAYMLGIGQLNVFDPQSDVYRQDSFYVVFLVLLLVCYRYLRKSVSLISQFIDKRQWSKFKQLNIQVSMTKTLHAYVEQLHRWRARFGGM